MTRRSRTHIANTPCARRLKTTRLVVAADPTCPKCRRSAALRVAGVAPALVALAESHRDEFDAELALVILSDAVVRPRFRLVYS